MMMMKMIRISHQTIDERKYTQGRKGEKKKKKCNQHRRRRRGRKERSKTYFTSEMPAAE